MTSAVKPLLGKVALVTGATRGIGKGVAVELGATGCTVYITGRTLKSSEGSLGSLEETALAIRNKGGICIPVQVDHEKENEIESLFQRIEKEQDGRLDILVNNAYKGVEPILDSTGKSFWEMSPTLWDDMNNVGLRNHYFCTVYAARLMVPRKQGIIIIVSSMGGLRYLFSVPYGIGKAACDRLAADTAVELKKHNVTSLSLWPGPVETELLQTSSKATNFRNTVAKYGKQESPEYVGKIVAHLVQSDNPMQYTGKIVLTGVYAHTFNIRDTDGQLAVNPRQISFLVRQIRSLRWLADYIPGFLKIPGWVMHLASNKF